MAKSLVIVESPAKAKTINKYLGQQYIVKSSVGHIRDLPTGGKQNQIKEDSKETAKPKKVKSAKKSNEKQKLFERMAIDPENGWKARYEILPGKEKVLNELKKYAKDADTIYLATDLDREGEAIAWHLREAIGGDPERYKRVTFAEITKNSIKAAFEKPGEISLDRVYAQQARRFLDRVVGFMISPLLWAKVARGLSAGRVQSVATRLIFEREREIHAFIPDEYWEIYADTLSDKDKEKNIRFAVSKFQDKPFKAVNEKEAMVAVDAIKKAKLKISERTDKPTRSKPSAPFITSTLQQAASLRLSFGVKKTMMMAQRLYEAGFITYMRTDSTNLSADAVTNCRDFISKQYGKKYLPDEAIVYASKKNAQEAHEAIRPSDVAVLSEQLPEDLDRDAVRLYDLIWRQFVACQMPPAEYDSTSVSIEVNDYTLKARGRVLRFDGYLKVMPSFGKKDEDDLELPDLQVGDELKLIKVDPQQKFTKPPPRYTEASLVKELEKRGIGRPSTYASIISTIQERGYVKAENRRFYCLKMGEIVSERLIESFRDLMDYSFTATMEEKLDNIATGENDWRKVLDNFYAEFTKQLEKAKENMRGNDPTLTDIKCPQCSRPMGIRTGRTGVFLGCSGYSLPPKERCKSTINLVAGEESKSIDHNLDDDEGNVAEIQNLRRCDKCGTAMDHYLIDETRKLHVCGNNPDCSGFAIEHGKFVIKGYDGPVIECDKCGKDMQLKSGRFGKYFGCSAYPDCKNTRKLLRNGEAAPPKSAPVHMPELRCEKSDGYFVLRDGAAGIFLASSAFPKSRETRKPRVEDLLRHKTELDPKYQFLATAPIEDPSGNPSVVRFSRKAKEHFIGSDDESGKPTKWTLVYQNKKWIEGAPVEAEG